MTETPCFSGFPFILSERSKESIMYQALVALVALGVAQSPAINPANARLEQTLGGLGGPGLALAYDEASGTLAAGCERGTIHLWGKGVSHGIRSGDHTPNVLHAHQGPVTALAWSGPLLASSGIDRKVVLWSLSEG